MKPDPAPGEALADVLAGEYEISHDLETWYDATPEMPMWLVQVIYGSVFCRRKRPPPGVTA